ncbi:phosphatidylserine/phosphatidylglycerophosphate/cardiolipin synthase family protein [uncultured Ilumatobacter sp.]|uniref:phospholipase D-like domain-containing protein n=1 Tax=uncultured Ilumatobacter sp. TaxID=879968 RepID=UPI00374F151D
MSRASSTTGPALASAGEWADRVHSLLGLHATEGNTVDVLRNGDEIFGAMLDAIDGAEQTVDIVTFVFWSGHVADRFAQALVGAANRGCRVRVLIDALAERKLDSQVISTIKGSSCELRWFRPFTDEKIPQLNGANNRTHRKILVVDGTVGFIGGVGIADEWSGNARNEHEYRDTHLRVRGPAVAGLQAGFIDNWADHNHSGFDPMSELVIDSRPAGTTACAVVQAAAENGSNDIWRLMITLIACAQQRIRIASAYFNPGEQLTQALVDAVERGVSVDIMLPGTHADKRFIQITGEASYQRLLQAGVVLRTYEVSMMHAKVMTVDGTVASVGSANFNQRSLRHDDEANIVVFDPDVVAVLDRHLDEDLEHCVLLDPQEWADRGLFQRVAERVTETVNHWL